MIHIRNVLFAILLIACTVFLLQTTTTTFAQNSTSNETAIQPFEAPVLNETQIEPVYDLQTGSFGWYKISSNNNTITINSNVADFEYDKLTCNFKLFDNGTNIGSESWVVWQSPLNQNNWIQLPVNNATCQTSTSNSDRGVTIKAIRQDVDGIFLITYKLDLLGIKTTISYTNYNELTKYSFWSDGSVASGNAMKFGFTSNWSQVKFNPNISVFTSLLGVPDNFNFGNYKHSLLDSKTVLASLSQVSDNPIDTFFGWNPVLVSFDFRNTSQPLQYGQTFSIDPISGRTATPSTPTALSATWSNPNVVLSWTPSSSSNSPFVVSPAGLGSAQDGAGFGGVTVSTSGKVNTAWSFDGVDDYVTVPYSSDFLLQKKSISFWVKRTGTEANADCLICIFDGSSMSPLRIVWSNPTQNKLYYGGWGSSGGNSVEVGNGVPTIGQWVHVVITDDGASPSHNIKSYVNGTLFANTSLSENYFGSTVNVPLTMMARRDGTALISGGALDEVMYFPNRILTASDVAELYNSGNGARASALSDKSNLSLYYDMDDPSASVLAQLSRTSDPLAIVGYKIERRLDNGTYSTITANTGSTAGSYTDSTVSSNNKYWYQVSAYNNDSYSAPSSESSVISATVPSAPLNLVATVTSPTSIQLNWNAPSSDGGGAIRGYKIERESPIGGGFSTLVANTTNTLINYNDTGLTLNTQYNYRIYALNIAGQSSASNQASATTYTVPSAPLTPNAVALNSTAITTSWSAPSSDGGSPVNGYKIEQALCNGGWSVAIANTTTSATSKVINGLNQVQCYNFRYYAHNLAGTGPASGNATATTLIVPSAPTGLTLTGLTPTLIQLNWNACTDNGTPVFGHSIQRNGTTLVNNTGTSSTTYTDSTGLAPYHQQTYRVACWSNAGLGLYSNNVTDFTPEYTSASVTITGSVIGNIATVTAKVDTILGFPAPTLSQLELYEGTTLLQTKSVSQVIAKGSSQTFTNALNATLSATKNLHVKVIISNGTGTATFSSTNQTFTPQFQYSSPLDPYGFAYNVNASRNADFSELNIKVLRQNTPWVLNLKAQWASNPNGTWYNSSGNYFVNKTFSVVPTERVYYTGYNPDIEIFSGVSEGSGSYNLNGTFTLIQDQFGDFFGAPVITAIILALAGIWTGKNANTGIIITLFAIAIFGAVGLLVINQAIWSLVVVMALLGVFLGRKFS